MLTALSVSNYRTFKSERTFEIAPISILLGANSSGKSSITRLFPLFSQSMSERSAAPVLWVADYLDYGSFYENVHLHDTTSPIEFTFAGQMEASADFANRRVGGLDLVEFESGPFLYKIRISGDRETTHLAGMTLSLYEQSVDLTFSALGRLEKILFHGVDYIDSLRGFTLYALPGLFPNFVYISREPSKTRFADSSIHLDIAARLLRAHAHQNTSLQAIRSTIRSFYLSSIEDTISHVRTSARQIQTLYRRLGDMPTIEQRRIWIQLFLAALPALLKQLQYSISGDIRGGGYLAPVRASAQRYYRRQEIAVDIIDPAGQNLPMYLNSLYEHELQELNSDFERFFGHRVQVKQTEGHISLRLESPHQEYSDNLADVGFGFSQLLPVIAQVHAARRAIRTPTSKSVVGGKLASPVLAIEQPELHLHPAYQGRLGEYFAYDALRKDVDTPPFRFFIETHSESLVNEIASLVGRGKLSADDVRIYLFERPAGSAETQVVQAEIKPDGTIPNWPFGFFASGRLSR